MSSNGNPPQPSKAPLKPPPDVTSALDLEANQLTKPPSPRRLTAFIPGFRNPTPFLVFLRRDWYDIATQLLCLLIAFLLYSLVPPIMPRYFPLYSGVEKSVWGMKHSQPYLAEYITTVVSAIVSFVVPALVMGAIALWGTRSFEDGNAALIGLGYALATSTLFQSFLKLVVGGLRPHFLSICEPTIPPSLSGRPTLPGSDMQYYTADQVCRGETGKIREAQMSFPSGHACAAFAGFGFLALWLNAKYKVFSQGGHFRDHYGGEKKSTTEDKVIGKRVHHWKLIIFMAPWCIATILSLSKIRDGWHHPVDVVFGALSGFLFAHMGYKMVYRSVYDSRTNHIPLVESEVQEDREGKVM